MVICTENDKDFILYKYKIKSRKIIFTIKQIFKDYFDKDEKNYIFKCKKCHKLAPVPDFIVSEQLGFIKFIKKKETPKMECPYFNGTMVPIKNFK